MSEIRASKTLSLSSRRDRHVSLSRGLGRDRCLMPALYRILTLLIDRHFLPVTHVAGGTLTTSAHTGTIARARSFFFANSPTLAWFRRVLGFLMILPPATRPNGMRLNCVASYRGGRCCRGEYRV